jgi:acetyl esterase/lipase
MRVGLVLMIASLLCGAAAAGDEIPLWPGVAPGSERWSYSEESTVSAIDHTRSIRNVVKPTLAVHLPAKSTGTAVMVIPGGGFETLAYDKEGDTVAAWLNSIGVAAFVLKYRVAHTEPGLDDVTRNARTNAVVPLATADSKQALRLIRSRAAEWDINPDRLGVMGFSAGGYLAIVLGSNYDAQTRPAFVAAIYAGSPSDLKVPEDAPPLFLAYAVDDPYVPRDSLGALNAWSNAKVPVELHAYAKGGHGFGLRKQGLPVNGWNERFVDWLKWLDQPVSASPTR